MTNTTPWTDAVQTALSLIDPWAKNSDFSQLSDLAREVMDETGLDFGDAFCEAADANGFNDEISDLLAVANFLMENPQHLGSDDDTVREAMGEEAPDSL